ncbi:MAG: hypothetical protein IPO38_09725 [Rhodocyclaceae bacterium]|nr:hypothetical protein [Rhodocyclaceae bacterium]
MRLIIVVLFAAIVAQGHAQGKTPSYCGNVAADGSKDHTIKSSAGIPAQL